MTLKLKRETEIKEQRCRSIMHANESSSHDSIPRGESLFIRDHLVGKTLLIGKSPYVSPADLCVTTESNALPSSIVCLFNEFVDGVSFYKMFRGNGAYDLELCDIVHNEAPLAFPDMQKSDFQRKSLGLVPCLKLSNFSLANHFLHFVRLCFYSILLGFISSFVERLDLYCSLRLLFHKDILHDFSTSQHVYDPYYKPHTSLIE
ncbi:hypothetical protein MtrunA17_Chr2g0310671 [Medicago truncatula]|uniref:Uncharacterized protein n=1 Tax=Medicago truncatula TaxID=3880 RepID=A0A396JAZ5_MEDTR|nr:hypothetical protein MtrunA17_Chr2g0310671 [Medicago truncatula]